MLVYDALALLEAGILGAPQPGMAFLVALHTEAGITLLLKALSLTLIFWLTVVVIIGLYRLRSWAWTLAMLILGVRLVLGIIDYFYRAPFFLSMFMQVLAVLLLNQESVRIAFGERVVAQEIPLPSDEDLMDGRF